jgi:hypothetical protein
MWMRVSVPERYKLTFSAEALTEPLRFSGIACSKKPKLYVVSVNEEPIYVGITKRRIQARLADGWSAKGNHGYYGYAWRHDFLEANLDVWCHEDAPAENAVLDMETVEAEVVFLIRRAGQWPRYQTEIHFHPSEEVHRQVAASIAGRYRLRVGNVSLPI